MSDATTTKSKIHKEALPKGYTLHWFELQSVLGRGGYGVTYLAVDKNLDRKVAIKEYLPVDFAARRDDQTVEPLSDEHTDMYQWGLSRFLKEARLLAKFNHPNIVRVINVFEQNGTAYMVMEYEHGKDLASVLRKKPVFKQEELLDIFIPVIDGLSLVHKAGFIHRDIKPSNIYIREDKSPVLLDFGSARQSAGNTGTLTSLVSYGYAPFEQYDEGSEKQGPWTDIYSLGATLYYCITKSKPEDALKRSVSILSGSPDPYQPVSLQTKRIYSENFLLSVDYAMQFYIAARPQDTTSWAQMLLGNIKARPLKSGQNSPLQQNGGATVSIAKFTDIFIRPRFKKYAADYLRNIKKPKHQQLIDPSGRRNQTHLSNDQNRHAASKPLVATIHFIRKYKSSIVIAVAATGLIFLLGTLANGKNSLVAQSWNSMVNRLSPPTSNDVGELLKFAKQDVKAGRLVKPDNNNAVLHYNRVLQIEPDNLQARKGIDAIAKLYRDATRQAIKANNIRKAEQLLTNFEIVQPHSSDASDLQQQIRVMRSNADYIDSLLKQARIAFDARRFADPPGNNALEDYREVLKMDSDNKKAQQGITDIYEHYKAAVTAQLSAGDFSNVADILAKMENIVPNSSDVRDIEKRYSLLKSKHSDINKTLELAYQASAKGSYLEPASGSAYYYYQSVLEVDPHNNTAIQGIRSIQTYFISEYEQALIHNRPNQVKRNIEALKFIDAQASSGSDSSQAGSDLKAHHRSDIVIINDLLGLFKKTLEHKNKVSLGAICEFSDGRQQFIKTFFSKYKSLVVKVIDFKYYPESHQAIAKIQFDRLISRSGTRVVSGDWATFDIALKRNKSRKWRVFW